MKNQILLALTALVCASLAKAQTSPPTDPTRVPTITVETGKPITADYGDGRVATIKRQVVDLPTALPLSFEVFDSLCSDTRGQACTYKTNFRTVFYYAVWSQHPDASKVNQLVHQKPYPGQPGDEKSLRFERSMTLFGPEQKVKPVLSKGLAMPTISCDDYTWLPNGTKEAPTELRARRWDGEMMTGNPESGANENRLYSTAVDVVWNKIDAQTLQLSSLAGYTSIYGFYQPVLMIGDVVTATLDDTKGGLCSVELKPVAITAAAVAAEKQIDSLRPAPDQSTDVVLIGSDESAAADAAKPNNYADGVPSLLSTMKSVQGGQVE